MNKYGIPKEQWLRLQDKSKLAWGAKWRFRKIADRRNLTADGIEALVDETIRFMELIRARLKEQDSSEARPEQAANEPIAAIGINGSSEGT